MIIKFPANKKVILHDLVVYNLQTSKYIQQIVICIKYYREFRHNMNL